MIRYAAAVIIMFRFRDNHMIFRGYHGRSGTGKEMNMSREFNGRSMMPLLVIVIVLSFTSVTAAVPPVNIDQGGLALRGYDPVAYFTRGKAVKGTEDYAYSWKGAVWWFVDQRHRELFIKNPGTYAPQYGGY